MAVRPAIKLTRKQIYDEIWSAAVSGMALKYSIDAHLFEPGDSNCETVQDQLYQAYAESRESDPPEIQAGFAELENFLETLPLSDNNAVFNLCCRVCTAYEYKSFLDGLQYGAHLMSELYND